MRPNYLKNRPHFRKAQGFGSRKEFWAKKSVGNSAFWEKKIFNHMSF